MSASIETVRARLRDLAAMARAAAKRKDWKTNHRLCREHDDLAIANPRAIGPKWSDKEYGK